jgi:hypothetical protein
MSGPVRCGVASTLTRQERSEWHTLSPRFCAEWFPQGAERPRRPEAESVEVVR